MDAFCVPLTPARGSRIIPSKQSGEVSPQLNGPRSVRGLFSSHKTGNNMTNLKLRQVHPEDFDVEALMTAAREGRLYVYEGRKSVGEQQVLNDVRTYVGRIEGCATARFRNVVSDIWNQILGSDDFVQLLKPGMRARDGRSFNTYNLMRIIGVLREGGVYEEYSQRKYDGLLEGTAKDSPYRKYLGMGFEDYSMVRKLQKIIKNAGS